VHLADIGPFLCSGSTPRTTLDAKPGFAANGVSLTPDGARATWKWLAEEPTIAAIVHHKRGR